MSPWIIWKGRFVCWICYFQVQYHFMVFYRVKCDWISGSLTSTPFILMLHVMIYLGFRMSSLCLFMHPGVNSWKHHYQLLFQPPLLKTPCDRSDGTDILFSLVLMAPIYLDWRKRKWKTVGCTSYLCTYHILLWGTCGFLHRGEQVVLDWTTPFCLLTNKLVHSDLLSQGVEWPMALIHLHCAFCWRPDVEAKLALP